MTIYADTIQGIGIAAFIMLLGIVSIRSDKPVERIAAKGAIVVSLLIALVAIFFPVI